MTIAGYVATEFEPVLDVFAQNFDEREDPRSEELVRAVYRGVERGS